MTRRENESAVTHMLKITTKVECKLDFVSVDFYCQFGLLLSILFVDEEGRVPNLLTEAHSV